MNWISKKELADELGVHVRTLCYHLKIKKGLKGYAVKLGKINYKGKRYNLPDRYDKRTRLIFVREEVEAYFGEDTTIQSAEF